jgi:excisionase family DNA binding protein
MGQIILNGLTTGQLKELLVEALTELLSSNNYLPSKNATQEEAQYLTRVEAAKLLKISLPTLHDYTKRGVISSYRIGANVRYKPADIDEALSSRNFTSGKRGGKRAA